jgi:hypothetical protein
MVDDDSACNYSVVANDCGDGPDVKCRGGVDQREPPACASGTCGGFTGATCGQDAFCYQGTCRPDQPNGERCPDDGACQSGHCENNVCCEDGACCTDDSQCTPIRECHDPLGCQGKRTDRRCDKEMGVCVNSEPVDDDASCLGRVSGTDCGLNLPLLCGAAPAQQKLPPSACPRCSLGLSCGDGAMLDFFGGCYVLENGMRMSVGPATPDASKVIGCRPVPGVTCTGAGRCEVP